MFADFALSLLRWQDLVDILLIALALTAAYHFLRGTAAFRVAAGVISLLGAGELASHFGLVMTANALRAAGAIATLVVVVVYRDEIRTVLRRVSPVRILRQYFRRPGDGRSQLLSRIAKSTFALASRRIGALIAIRRHDHCEHYVSGGTRLDAPFSLELVESLLQPASPLHDGALLVERGRVRRAGAVLPLAGTPFFPSYYGTRHRAAAGLSRECDALVIAVSEERGEVTLFEGGKPQSLGSADELEEALRTRLLPSAKVLPESELGRRARQWGYVAMTFLVALALSAAVHVLFAGSGEVLVSRTVPVELVGLSGKLDAAPPSPERVTVQLRGPEPLLDEIQSGTVRAASNLSGLGPGVHRVRVRAEVPSGVEVARILPEHVWVNVRAPKDEAARAPPAPGPSG